MDNVKQQTANITRACTKKIKLSTIIFGSFQKTFPELARLLKLHERVVEFIRRFEINFGTHREIFLAKM